LHRPHHAVRQQISKLHSEVYVSARTRGSPAYQYGLAPTNFITHVNGKPTPDLESFLKAVVGIPDNTCMLLFFPAHSISPSSSCLSFLRTPFFFSPLTRYFANTKL
jgi:C-terminal processing protease CtpA/Prc